MTGRAILVKGRFGGGKKLTADAWLAEELKNGK